MGDLGVFEAMANAGKLSAEAAAEQGFELEKKVDRAIFRAKERFGAYLANSQSKSDFEQRWSQVKSEVIKTIAEVTFPTPGIIRRVGAALRPPVQAQAPAKKVRPSSAKATGTERQRREAADAYRDGVVPGSGQIIEPMSMPATTPAAGNSSPARSLVEPGMDQPYMQAAGQPAMPRVGSTDTPWVSPAEALAMSKGLKKALTADLQKTAWAYDNTTKLYTSKDPMQKFACPGCGTEQDHLGFTHCAGCDRTWNSWPVRQTSSGKTSASTYVLMAREIKMRGDQFKMASMGNVSVTSSVPKVAEMPMQQPNFGTMPGDNSAAMGSPMPPEQPPAPAAAPPEMAPPGDTDHDGDVAGGITEGSPIDQIQDALEDAVMALKGVQVLSINPVLAKTASTRVAALRTAMDRFWVLHRKLNYVAGMLAKEANEAIREADPRITSESLFVEGFNAAAKNQPLPSAEKTKKPWLEGYIAFHAQADSYSDGANYDQIFEPDSGQDTTNGTRNDGTYLGDGGLDDSPNNQSDAGPFDTSQPASREFASQMDTDNAQGGADRGQGESSTIQPTSARRRLPKGRR